MPTLNRYRGRHASPVAGTGSGDGWVHPVRYRSVTADSTRGEREPSGAGREPARPPIRRLVYEARLRCLHAAHGRLHEQRAQRKAPRGTTRAQHGDQGPPACCAPGCGPWSKERALRRARTAWWRSARTTPRRAGRAALSAACLRRMAIRLCMGTETETVSRSTGGAALDAATMPSRNGEAKPGGRAAPARVRGGRCRTIDMGGSLHANRDVRKSGSTRAHSCTMAVRRHACRARFGALK